MQLIDQFLRDHAFVHSEAVAVSEAYNMDFLIRDLSDEQVRICLYGQNSLAWLLWHMARVEDAQISVIVAGREQLLDEGDWAARLKVAERGVGTGMTKAQVAELSEAIDLQALWEYRSAVGRRTREFAADLWAAGRWEEPATSDDVKRAVAAGLYTPEDGAWAEKFLVGKSRESMLNWWGLQHSLMHLGQAIMVRRQLLPREEA